MHRSCPQMTWRDVMVSAVYQRCALWMTHAEHFLVPSGIAVSPNNILLCSILPHGQGSRISVYTLPKRNLHSVPTVLFPSPVSNSRDELSKALCAAIYGRRSPSDVIHSLTLATTPYQTAVNTVYGALTILETNTFGLTGMWMDEIIGTITEVYL